MVVECCLIVASFKNQLGELQAHLLVHYLVIIAVINHQDLTIFISFTDRSIPFCNFPYMFGEAGTHFTVQVIP